MSVILSYATKSYRVYRPLLVNLRRFISLPDLFPLALHVTNRPWVSEDALEIAIRENDEIKGIVIDKQETKLLQYAHDTTAVLSNAEPRYKLFQLLDEFKKVSGLKVDNSKTEGLWIGRKEAKWNLLESNGHKIS